MLNPDELIIDFNKNLKKLSNIIQNQATFTFGSTRLVNKKRVDDILCVLITCFPEEYRKYLERYGNAKLKSNNQFKALKEAIQNKFLWSTSSYNVNLPEALQQIRNLQTSFGRDIEFIFSESSGMF